jgi:hypothetical protein
MSELILEMKHITKTFPGVRALEDIDIWVQDAISEPFFRIRYLKKDPICVFSGILW